MRFSGKWIFRFQISNKDKLRPKQTDKVFKVIKSSERKKNDLDIDSNIVELLRAESSMIALNFCETNTQRTSEAPLHFKNFKVVEMFFSVFR